MRKRHPTSEIWVLKKSRENQSSWSEERTIGISLSQLFYRLDSTVTLPRACSLTPSNSCGELAHKETVLDFVPASRWRDGPGRGAVEWTHSVLYTNCVVETELFFFFFLFFPPSEPTCLQSANIQLEEADVTDTLLHQFSLCLTARMPDLLSPRRHGTI